MTVPVDLEQIFGAFVNQDTLEDAASWMADLVVSYPELRIEFESALTGAIVCGVRDEASVIAAVNRSGYRVTSANDAKGLCSDLLKLFQAQLVARP